MDRGFSSSTEMAYMSGLVGSEFKVEPMFTETLASTLGVNV